MLRISETNGIVPVTETELGAVSRLWRRRINAFYVFALAKFSASCLPLYRVGFVNLFESSVGLLFTFSTWMIISSAGLILVVRAR